MGLRKLQPLLEVGFLQNVRTAASQKLDVGGSIVPAFEWDAKLRVCHSLCPCESSRDSASLLLTQARYRDLNDG